MMRHLLRKLSLSQQLVIPGCVQAANAAAAAHSDKETSTAAGGVGDTWSAVVSWRVWWLAAVALLEAIVKYGIVYWCPLLIRSMLTGPGPLVRPMMRALGGTHEAPVPQRAPKLPRALLSEPYLTVHRSCCTHSHAKQRISSVTSTFLSPA